MVVPVGLQAGAVQVAVGLIAEGAAAVDLGLFGLRLPLGLLQGVETRTPRGVVDDQLVRGDAPAGLLPRLHRHATSRQPLGPQTIVSSRVRGPPLDRSSGTRTPFPRSTTRTALSGASRPPPRSWSLLPRVTRNNEALGPPTCERAGVSDGRPENGRGLNGRMQWGARDGHCSHL